MSGPQHTKTVEIDAPAERIWQAITDPAQTPLYFYGSHVTSDWQIGGPIEYRSDDGVAMIAGTVLACEPPHRLVTTFRSTWDEAAAADRPSRVSWTIEPAGNGCRLTLVHDDFDGETATYRGVDAGWDYILAGLKSVLETGKPLPAPVEA